MKIGLMPGTPAAEMRAMGFEALQMFFANGEDDAKDPTAEAIAAQVRPGDLALAAMTIHVDLVGPTGALPSQVDRAIRLVKKTAELRGLVGDNPRPILVWHPSSYPAGPEVNDAVIFRGLCSAIAQICEVAQQDNVDFAVEMTRDGSVSSAESFLRIKDHVGSPALRVCLDAANIAPDRTPLERSVRMLADDIVIAHGKDVHFQPTGQVAAYGPIGSGKLDYAAYIRCLREYCQVPYFILEYYKTREQMLLARDVVLKHLGDNQG